jgi:hypothetical protein
MAFWQGICLTSSNPTASWRMRQAMVIAETNDSRDEMTDEADGSKEHDELRTIRVCVCGDGKAAVE